MTVVCPACSSEIDDAAQTCPVCGGSLMGAPWVAPTPSADQASMSSDSPPSDESDDDEFIPLRYPEPSSRRRFSWPTGWRGAILAAAAIVMLAAAIWGFTRVFGDGNDDDANQGASDVREIAVPATPGTARVTPRVDPATDLVSTPIALDVRAATPTMSASPVASPRSMAIDAGTATPVESRATMESAASASPGPALDASPAAVGSSGDIPGVAETAGPLGSFVQARAQEVAAASDAPEASPASPAGDGTGGPLPNAGTPPPRGGV